MDKMLQIDPTKLTKKIKNKYSVVSNAFRLSGGKKVKVKDGKPKDLIITEVGDVKQEEFYPQVKIGRWCDDDNTNEVNLSVRLIDNEIGKETLATENDKIKWSKGNKTARFYEIEPNEDYPEGAFEFDIELSQKPKTNKIEFSLNTKGVDFFYQPALTQQEIDEGAFRPENVVGSYAVYASEQKTNWKDGKEYKVGKVGHIYRPKIFDATGARVWGILSIDKEAGKLTVEIPQEFLDKAVYPVVVDPTFGYTTQGASSDSIYNIIKGSVFAGASGTLTKLSICVSNANSNWLRMGMYLHSDSSRVINATNSTDGYATRAKNFYHTASTLSVAISAVNYVLVGSQNDTGSYIYYDAGDANQGHYQGSYFPDPASFTENNNKYSIYATYTAGGGGPTKLKTWNGLAVAKIKTINGLEIAKVKTINGLP